MEHGCPLAALRAEDSAGAVPFAQPREELELQAADPALEGVHEDTLTLIRHHLARLSGHEAAGWL